MNVLYRSNRLVSMLSLIALLHTTYTYNTYNSAYSNIAISSLN